MYVEKYKEKYLCSITKNVSGDRLYPFLSLNMIMKLRTNLCI